MLEIYVVRHGETAWSRDQRHTSVTDLDLTEEGVRQARALRDRLPDPAAFDLVLCSPRLRARRTAALAGFDRTRVAIDEDLAEWGYGDYEGLTSAEIQRHVPGWTVWTAPVPGGESSGQVRTRLTRVIDRVEASGVERVICIGHAHSLRVMTLIWLDVPFERGDSYPLGTAGIGVLGRFKDRRALLRWNA